MPQLGLFTNPYLLGAIVVSWLLQISLLWFPPTREIFFTAPPRFGLDWILIFLLALAPVSLVEIRKYFRSRERR